MEKWVEELIDKIILLEKGEKNMKTKTEAKLFQTSVRGVGPFCIEFTDGEIVTTRNHARQLLIVAAPETAAERDRLKEINAELLEACNQFLHYAESGKHPYLKNYIGTIAGAKMKAAIAKAEASK